MNDAFHKKSKWKRRALLGLGYFSIFAATTATVFFVTEQKVNVIDLRTSGDDAGHTLTKKELVLAKAADSVKSGLHITVDDFTFDQYYVKEENGEMVPNTEKGHNTISSFVNAQGVVEPIEIALKLDSLSLHGISFGLEAPITYSNDHTDARSRGVKASLVQDGDNSSLYLNLYSNDPLDNIAEPWDFKYKVNIAPKDETDENGNKIMDPFTHGISRFEYGDLDWLLSNVLETLSTGGINVSFDGWFNNLTKKNAANPAPNQDNNTSSSQASSVEESSSSEDSSATSSDGGIDINAIMESMNEMVDVTPSAGTGYFIWNIPLSDDFVIPLGLSSDTNNNLSGVDLPAKYKKNETNGNYESVTDPWIIQDGMSLQAHAKIDSNIDTDILSAPSDANSYRKLDGSNKLFTKIAELAVTPSFDFDLDLEIGNHQDSKEGTRTVLRKNASDEAMKLTVNGAMGAKYNSSKGGYDFNGVNVEVKADKARENNEFNGHSIKVAYLPEEDSEFAGYVNINDVFTAKVGSTYINELYTQIKDAFLDSSEESSTTSTQTDLSALEDFLDLLEDDITIIRDIRSSDLMDAIKSGSYSKLLDFVKEIKNSDNTIVIVISLEPAGVKGEITLTLDGNDSSASIASIKFGDAENPLSFGGISIKGELTVNPNSDPNLEKPLPANASENYEWKTFSHLKGIVGQVNDIVDNKSVQAGISGKLHGEGEEISLGLNGSVAFDFGGRLIDDNPSTKLGLVKLNIDHPIGDKREMHNVSLGLENDFKSVAFSYDSKAPVGEENDYYGQVTDNQITGKLNLDTALDTLKETTSLDTLIKLFVGDDRFARLSAALVSETSGSLLGDLLHGKVFGLLDNKHILSQIDLGATTTVVIDGHALGLKEGMTITLLINYGGDGLVFEGEDAINNIQILLKDENITKFELTIGGIKPLGNQDQIDFDSTNFDDLSPVVDLAGEFLNTFRMGMYLDNANALHGVSDYHLHGNIDLNITGYNANIYDFDAYAAVEGAETKIEVDFNNLPVIRGINGPDDPAYFRANELEGERDSSIYFYANGVDPEGQILMQRNSSYGRVRDVRDAVRMSGKDFTDDFLGWILKYTLGVNEELLEADEGESNNNETPTTETETASAWNPISKGIHLADAWGGFKADKTASDNQTTYILSLDLGKLLNIGILGEAEIVLVSKDLYRDGFKARCLTGVGIYANAKAKETSGNRVAKLASVAIELELVNFGAKDNEGYAVINSVLADDSYAYYNEFVKQVADNGILTAEAKGKYYNLPANGWFSEDANNEDYNLYCYNLTDSNWTEEKTSSNFYRLSV